jgi:hypothetical protein
VGHLQHGSLLLGIRAIDSHTRYLTTLQWKPSHPGTKPQSKWTVNDWSIHQVDLIAGTLEAPLAKTIRTYRCTSEELHAVVTPPGTWQWQLNGSPFHGSLKARAHSHLHRQYTKQRDMQRIYANAPSRWTKYCAPLMADVPNICMIGWHMPLIWRKPPFRSIGTFSLAVTSAPFLKRNSISIQLARIRLW